MNGEGCFIDREGNRWDGKKIKNRLNHLFIILSKRGIRGRCFPIKNAKNVEIGEIVEKERRRYFK